MIEERLYFEEYEDPSQEFSLEDFEKDYENVSKKIKTKNLVNINKNMLKLHRSDSMDQILEKINLENEDGKGSKYTSAGMINKLTLKLNDINKEFEY